MHPKSPMWLDTIAEACAFITEATAGRSRTDYEQDRTLRQATERGVGIIGRALSRIEQVDPVTIGQITDYRTIMDIGVRLIPEYDPVDNDQVWALTQQRAPILHAEVRALLSKEAPKRVGCASEHLPSAGGTMIAIVADNLATIRALCEEYGVARLEVFGSAATGTFDSDQSDVDFIVDYPPDYEFGHWLTRYFELKERLEGVLGRPVDLVMAGAMRKPYFIQSANESRRLLYAA